MQTRLDTLKVLSVFHKTTEEATKSCDGYALRRLSIYLTYDAFGTRLMLKLIV